MEEFKAIYDFPTKFRRGERHERASSRGFARINEDPEHLGRPRGIYDAAPTAIAEITN